ncbi:hypothetical protein QPK87_04770 [Kamptonema cortianum]|nr:hypothetical protein [Geitlerinema splendidum]MDK3155889.1 hypothetical protein [Kamptonema cortianum]
METILKKFGLDIGSLKLAYLMGREKGRQFVKGALIFPGIRIADLERQAARNGDDPAELIGKREVMLDAMLDFIEEFVNLDND